MAAYRTTGIRTISLVFELIFCHHRALINLEAFLPTSREGGALCHQILPEDIDGQPF